MNNLYEPNKIYSDEFGRISGIFLVDKPIGKTSHDMVYEFRRKFETKKVGHAGALDPFATGLLIILVGKAAKLSDSFLGLDKEYEAEIAFGFKTDTLDTEGKLVATSNKEFDLQELKDVLESFKPEYLQEIPIYSSVKVKGDKLRELVRRSESNVITNNADGSRSIQFHKEGKILKELIIPQKVVKIYNLELLDLASNNIDKYNFPEEFLTQLREKNIMQFKSAKILANVSKGTYIRKLAEDIGDKLQTSAMLVNLKRTKVGEYTLENKYID